MCIKPNKNTAPELDIIKYSMFTNSLLYDYQSVLTKYLLIVVVTIYEASNTSITNRHDMVLPCHGKHQCIIMSSNSIVDNIIIHISV